MATGTGQEVGFTFKATDKTGKAMSGIQSNLKKTNKEANYLSARFRNMARATAAIEGPLGGTAGRLSVIATLLGSAHVGMVAFSAAMTGLTLVAGLSIKRFGEFEEVTNKVSSMLKVTGQASGLTANEINNLADEIGEATLQSRNGVLEASAVLLSFKSIAGDSFKSTMRVAADMSALVGTDLKSSVVQLGKALEDPERGLSALARSGISFTQTQKDAIVEMQKLGDAAGAQAKILGILEGQLGGTGAAAGKGLSGAVDLVSHGWDKFLVQLASSGAGENATKILARIGSGMNNVANKMDDYHNTEDKIAKVLTERFALTQRISAEIALGDRGSELRLSGMQDELKVITERANVLDYILRTEEFNRKKAEEAAAKQKQMLANEAAAVAAKEAAEKLADERKKEREKAETGADKYGEQLAKQSLQLQDSLVTKTEQEDLYLERRLEKIRANNEAGLLNSEETLEQEQSAYAIHAINTHKIDEEMAKRRKKGEQQLSKTLMSMRLQVAQQAVNLFKMIAGDSKAAKIAGIALEKGIAIAQTVMSTETAAMQAFSSQLIPGDPTSLGRASAAAAAVKSLGAVSVGIIAATGLAQAAAISKGGGGGLNVGSAGGGAASTPALETPALFQEALLPDQNTQSSINITINNPELLSNESIDRLIDGIKDQVDNRDVILVSSTSRNAQELAPA